jgi:hypothetical protein
MSEKIKVLPIRMSEKNMNQLNSIKESLGGISLSDTIKVIISTYFDNRMKFENKFGDQLENKQKKKDAKKKALQSAIDYINNISDSDFYALREKLVELDYIQADEYTLDGDDSIVYKDVIGRNSAGYIALMVKSRTDKETEYSSSFDRKMLPELKNDLIKRNLILQAAGINIEDYI